MLGSTMAKEVQICKNTKNAKKKYLRREIEKCRALNTVFSLFFHFLFLNQKIFYICKWQIICYSRCSQFWAFKTLGMVLEITSIEEKTMRREPRKENANIGNILVEK